MSDRFDAVVVGAGPAGAVAARVLATSGRSTLMVDGSAASTAHPVGETLVGAARPLLAKLGLLEPVERAGHRRCFGTHSAWGRGNLVTVDAIRDPHGAGWHLDRARFDEDLRQAAVAAGACRYRGRSVRVEFGDGAWRVRLADRTVRARVVVDGTGRASSVARSLGAIRSRDEALVGLAAWFKVSEQDRDARTLVESMADGWWYSARLPASRRVAILHVDRSHARAILKSGAFERCMKQAPHTHRLLSQARLEKEPQAYEASGARLDRFAGPGWLAVGDAALSFDPLSSQGLFNALYTGMLGGQCASELAAIRPAQSKPHAHGPYPLTRVDGERLRPPLDAYAQRLSSIRNAYVSHHRAVYASEWRYRHRPFWSRRTRRVPLAIEAV